MARPPVSRRTGPEPVPRAAQSGPGSVGVGAPVRRPGWSVRPRPFRRPSLMARSRVATRTSRLQPASNSVVSRLARRSFGGNSASRLNQGHIWCTCVIFYEPRVHPLCTVRALIAHKLLTDSGGAAGADRGYRGRRSVASGTGGASRVRQGTKGDAAGKAVNRKVVGSSPSSGASAAFA